jgi:hypothetical protein
MRDLDWKPILIVSALISAVHLAMLVLYPFPSVFLFPLVLIVLLVVVLIGILALPQNLWVKGSDISRMEAFGFFAFPR